MAKSNPFVEFVIHDAMSDIDGISVRAMFGGHGLYQHGVFFALIFNDELYFKVDDENRPDYEKAGSSIFTYSKKGKDTHLSYWTVPADVLEDRRALDGWIEKAVAAGMRAKK